MSAIIHVLPHLRHRHFVPALPAARWRLRLRAWWLARRASPPLTLLQAHQARPQPRLPASQPAPVAAGDRSLERELLELNLLFERARLAGIDQRAAAQVRQP